MGRNAANGPGFVTKTTALRTVASTNGVPTLPLSHVSPLGHKNHQKKKPGCALPLKRGWTAVRMCDSNRQQTRNNSYVHNLP